MPSKCYMCNWDVGHDPICPTQASDPKEAERVFHIGWKHGRSGGSENPGTTSYQGAYHLGYLEGVCALEEAENGEDPRFDQ